MAWELCRSVAPKDLVAESVGQEGQTNRLLHFPHIGMLKGGRLCKYLPMTLDSEHLVTDHKSEENPCENCTVCA